MLEMVARKLDKLNEEVLYLGGCATALFINDPLALDVRPTKDVDCIIDVISLSEYYSFQEKLKKIGFKESMQDEVICRYCYEDMILDVIPAGGVPGFANRWYKPALKHPIHHDITGDIAVKTTTAPYFLASKIEAYKDRGNNDMFASSDFEDIITVVAGREGIENEVLKSETELKTYLKKFFNGIMEDSQFEQALPGHVSDGPVTMQRAQKVKERIEKIIN